MSAKILGRIWDLVLTPAQQIVMLALADHADHVGGSIKPGVPLVAWKTGYSERQVRRIMHELETSGLLVKEQERRGKPTVYRIDLSKGVPKEPYVPREDRKTRDKMSVTSTDNLTPDKLSPLTLRGENIAPTPDMASAETARIHQKDEPSINNNNPPQVVDPEAIGKVVRAYESHIGMITPHIKELLLAAVEAYPLDWILEAINIAVENNVLKWRYAGAILESWRTKGKTGGKKILSIEDAPTNEALTEQARLRELKAKAAAEEQARLREKAQERSA